VECVAAEYQPYLWEEFHLLMLDGGYSTDFFEIGNNPTITFALNK
jgi:hypothetical protein